MDLVAEPEPESFQRSLKPGRTIDGERGVLDIMLLAELPGNRSVIIVILAG